MLSEHDFNDLIQMDKSDSRRHLWLTGLIIALAACVSVMPSFITDEAALDIYSKVAGVGTALLGAVPIAKLMAIRKNIDRINLIRNRWRRLKEIPGDTNDELSKISELVWTACR
jgi:hypothetical protein